MGGGGKKQTVGYKYNFAIHMGLGRGPRNVLKHIKVGDRTAWQGSQTTNGLININQPNLFGGDEKEGGVVGTFEIFFGGAAQLFSTLAKSLMGGTVPEFRGVTTAFFRGQIAANNPYPKPWRFRSARWSEGWDIDPGDPHRSTPWYSVMSRILMADGAIDAMNPAHIIYQCLTDRKWGRGIHPSWIHDTSFISAANTLCAEGFGLCLRWTRQEDVGPFIDTVLSHINAVLFDDPETGKVGLRLIRGDYDPDTLPVFTPTSGLLKITEDETGGGDTAFNEIIVKYVDPVADAERSVREHSLGLMQATGEIVSTTASYPGIPTADLALRVANRDLQLQVASRRFTLSMDRRAWRLVPGSVFKVSVPARGIDGLILRVATTEDHEFTDGTITVRAIEDYFGMPASSFSDPVDGAWTPPDNTATVPSERRIEEIPFRDLAQTLSPGDLAVLTDAESSIITLVKQPSGTAVNYDVASAADGEAIVVRGTGDWTPGAALFDDVGHYDTTFTFTVDSDLSAAQVGEAALVGNEIVRIDAVDAESGTITVARGCSDTVPEAHEAGERVWFYEGLYGSDNRRYADAEVVEVKILTRTPSDALTIDEAPSDTITIYLRQARPLPPGDVRVEGGPCFALPEPAYVGELTFTWSHRDRLLQADQLVEHEGGSIGPEDGTTYNIHVYDGETHLRSVTGITGTSWTYTSGMIAVDGEPTGDALTFQLESERDGLTSWQSYEFQVPRQRTVTVQGQLGQVVVSGISFEPRSALAEGVLGAVIVAGGAGTVSDGGVETGGMGINTDPHLYWRVRAEDTTDHAVVAIAEIEMRGAVGGADQCTGGTPFATSTLSSYAAANAFNNSTTGDPWAGAPPAAVGYQFASPVNVDQLLLSRSTSFLDSYNPFGVDLEWSDDGVNYWVHSSFDFTAWSGTTFTFDISPDPSAAYTTWRVLMRGNSSEGFNACTTAELEFATTWGGADECVGGTPSNTNTFDDDPETVSQTLNPTIRRRFARSYVMPSAKAIREARLTVGAGDFPTEVIVQFLVSGTTWKTVYQKAGLTWTAGETKTFRW